MWLVAEKLSNIASFLKLRSTFYSKRQKSLSEVLNDLNEWGFKVVRVDCIPVHYTHEYKYMDVNRRLNLQNNRKIT